MRKVLDHVQPSGPRRKGILDVPVECLVEGWDELPDVTDQVEADDAQRNPGQTSLLGVRLARSEPVSEAAVPDEPRGVGPLNVVAGRCRPAVDVEVFDDFAGVAD